MVGEVGDGEDGGLGSNSGTCVGPEGGLIGKKELRMSGCFFGVDFGFLEPTSTSPPIFRRSSSFSPSLASTSLFLFPPFAFPLTLRLRSSHSFKSTLPSAIPSPISIHFRSCSSLMCFTAGLFNLLVQGVSMPITPS